MILVVAAAAHDDWRAGYRARHGDAPRIKPTGDLKLLDRGIGEVDLAALAFEDLPADWQAENRAGAACAVDEVLVAARAGRPLDADFVEEAAAVLHVRWLERNAERAPDHQRRPY